MLLVSHLATLRWVATVLLFGDIANGKHIFFNTKAYFEVKFLLLFYAAYYARYGKQQP